MVCAAAGLCAAAQLEDGTRAGKVTFVRLTTYLNGARAVVTHTMDDSNDLVPTAIDAMDKYNIKATLYVSTSIKPIEQLWPRLRKAIENGHEVGAHSSNHKCKWPDTPEFCATAYSDGEVAGARDAILKNTNQGYVWSWAYPCGLCTKYEDVHAKLAAAGYIMARTYPDEPNDGHVVPDLQTWSQNWYTTAYTQACQKIGGIAKTGRTDVAALNAKFDEVYQAGGIYSFMSHAQWLDFGPDAFYERHLAHIGNRSDIWYVPTGILYSYKASADRTKVRPMKSGAKFVVSHDLDPKIHRSSVTLEFNAPGVKSVTASGRALAERKDAPLLRWDGQYFRRAGDTLYVTVQPNTILELRF
jgi:hypothetical protein